MTISATPEHQVTPDSALHCTAAALQHQLCSLTEPPSARSLHLLLQQSTDSTKCYCSTNRNQRKLLGAPEHLNILDFRQPQPGHSALFEFHRNSGAVHLPLPCPRCWNTHSSILGWISSRVSAHPSVFPGAVKESDEKWRCLRSCSHHNYQYNNSASHCCWDKAAMKSPLAACWDLWRNDAISDQGFHSSAYVLLLAAAVQTHIYLKVHLTGLQLSHSSQMKTNMQTRAFPHKAINPGDAFPWITAASFPI